MLTREGLSYGKSLVPLRVPRERTLIAAIAIAFLILHILAGTTLQRAAVAGPGAQEEEARYSVYD